MADTTAMGDEYRSFKESGDIAREVVNVQPKDVFVSVNTLEIRGERGPLLIDGQEVRHVTGIKLEWSVECGLWKVEIAKLILPWEK